VSVVVDYDDVDRDDHDDDVDSDDNFDGDKDDVDDDNHCDDYDVDCYGDDDCDHYGDDVIKLFYSYGGNLNEYPSIDDDFDSLVRFIKVNI